MWRGQIHPGPNSKFRHGQNVSWTKISRGQNVSGAKMGWGQNVSGAKMWRGQIVFGDKVWWGQNVPSGIRDQTKMGPNCVWGQNVRAKRCKAKDGGTKLWSSQMCCLPKKSVFSCLSTTWRNIQYPFTPVLYFHTFMSELQMAPIIPISGINVPNLVQGLLRTCYLLIWPGQLEVRRSGLH